MLISVHNRDGNDTKSSTSVHIFDIPNKNSNGPPEEKILTSIPSTATHFLSVLLSRTGILATISLLLGIEVGKSAASFCLAIISFLGGTRLSQEDASIMILVYLCGFFVGYNKATAVVVLLFWLVAFVCQLRSKDVVLMTVAYWFGIMGNVSNHVFFVVMFSFIGGKTVQYDQGIFVYVGLTLLIASMGKMNETFPLLRNV